MLSAARRRRYNALYHNHFIVICITFLHVKASCVRVNFFYYYGSTSVFLLLLMRPFIRNVFICPISFDVFPLKLISYYTYESLYETVAHGHDVNEASNTRIHERLVASECVVFCEPNVYFIIYFTCSHVDNE